MAKLKIYIPSYFLFFIFCYKVALFNPLLPKYYSFFRRFSGHNLR